MSFAETKVLTYRTQTCYLCGVPFAMELEFDQRRREHGESFWCPNGHPQCYTENAVKKLQRELEETQRQLRTAKCDALAEKQAKEKAERSKARVLTRVKNGVCPECNRSFANLRRHMQSKHKCS